MKRESFAAAALAAALLLALPACGKTPLPGKSGQDASPMESAEGPADVTPSADTGISSGGGIPQRAKTLRQTGIPPRMTRGRPSLRKACWKTTASNRTTTRSWTMASIRSTWRSTARSFPMSRWIPRPETIMDKIVSAALSLALQKGGCCDGAQGDFSDTP